MKNGLILLICQFLILPITASTQEWNQVWLERYLETIEPADNFPDGEPQDVPRRYRDGIADSAIFFSRTGCTTNQFIEGLFRAATNSFASSDWDDEERDRISSTAIWKLTEIGLPVVTNFFKFMIDSDTNWYKGVPLCAYFWRTNLEPEILSYMRTLCVQTNIYDSVASSVMLDMFETLSTMPDAMKPAATNRVAQYMYFAIHYVTDSQGWQDIELSRFIPAYSNSIQRLQLMQYVASSATNAWERSNAASVVQALSSIPTNQLNDVSWITE